MEKEGIKEIGAGGLETIGAPVSSGTGSGVVIAPDVKYQAYTAASGDTSITDILPATGEKDVIYRVGSWDGTQVDASKMSEYAWDGGDYVLLRVVDSIGGGVFDVSAYNASGGTLATYADLAAALEDVPDGVKHGGMELCFVRTSDDKYVQYRLTADEFSTDVEDWEQAASVAQLEELEDNVVMTGTYDATVAVGLADNLRGDAIVSAEFYYRKTGGTQSVGSGIAAIKEVRGKSIVWNQQAKTSVNGVAVYRMPFDIDNSEGSSTSFDYVSNSNKDRVLQGSFIKGHKYYVKNDIEFTSEDTHEGFYDSSLQNLGIPFSIGSRIGTAAATGKCTGLRVASLVVGKHISGYITFKVHDLTLMFGAGNEPATAAEFEKMFPLDYYDYNVGEVIPFAGENLVTIGKNQYNPATGKANLLGGQTYQLLGTYISATIDGVAVTLDSNNCFTTTKDCVLDVTGGNDTDTFVGLYNGETNTYEPYEKHTLPLDPSQWRDKQGNLVFPNSGMHGVGTAYDYVKVDSDGYIRKANLVYGGIDLGNYDYIKQGNLYTTSGFVPPKANMLCGKGKGVVWNQILQNGNFIDATGWSFSPFTPVFLEGGGIKCTINRKEAYNQIQRALNATIPGGHKVLLRILHKTPSGVNIYLIGEPNYAIWCEIHGQGNTEYEAAAFIRTPSEACNRIEIRIDTQTVSSTPVDVYLSNFQVFDLTLMFGAGNEPTSVAEFEAMCPLDYYAYDAGSLGILANQTYADAAAFKAAMQSVPLIYELATPVEVELATPVYAKYLVDKDGTEEITPANGAAPYTTPANLSILYAMDARGTIANLPKNYLSKESTENMLNAMVTAGIIASYTMTYDAANGRYQFAIVAPTQSNE